MSNDKSSGSSGGMGFCSVLFLIFLTLKLVGMIDWSWWWITSPIWMPLGLGLIMVAVCWFLAWWTGQLGGKTHRK